MFKKLFPVSNLKKYPNTIMNDEKGFQKPPKKSSGESHQELNNDINNDLMDKKPSAEEYSKNDLEIEKKTKKKRLVKHDKRRSIKKKSKMLYNKLCEEYNNFMLSNQVKKKNIGNHHI